MCGEVGCAISSRVKGIRLGTWCRDISQRTKKWREGSRLTRELTRYRTSLSSNHLLYIHVHNSHSNLRTLLLNLLPSFALFLVFIQNGHIHHYTTNPVIQAPHNSSNDHTPSNLTLITLFLMLPKKLDSLFPSSSLVSTPTPTMPVSAP